MKKQNKKTIEKSSGIWSSTTNAGTGAGWMSGICSDFQLAALYVNNPVCHAAISMVAGAVASTDFNLFQIPQNKRQKPIQINDHPLLDLMHNENEMLHASDMLRLVATYLMVAGRAYIYMNRSTITNKVESLQILQPWWVEPYRNVNGTINSYFYMMQGGQNLNRQNKVSIDIADMLDVRFPSISDPYGGGDSPLRSAFLIASLSNKFLQYQSQIFDNKARPDALFSPNGEISEEEQKVLSKKFDDRYRGTGNGKVMIANGKFTPLNWNPTDLASLKIDHELKINICNALHVPVVLMDENPNRAGIESAIVQFQRDAVCPLVHLIEQKLNRKLTPEFGSNLKIIFNEVITEDATFAAEQAQQKTENTLNVFKSGAMSINEFRATLNPPLPPIINGDDIVLPPATTPFAPEGLPEDVVPEPLPEPTPAVEPAKAIDVNLMLSINAKVYSRELPRSVAISLAAVASGQPEETIKNLIGFPGEAPAAKQCQCGQCGNKASNTSTDAQRSDPEASESVLDVKSNENGCPVPEGTELVEPMTLLYQYAHEKLSEQIPAIAESMTAGKAATPDDKEFVYLDEWDSRCEKKLMPLIEVYAKQGSDWLLGRVGGSPHLDAVIPPKINEAMRKSSMRLAQSTMNTTLHDVNTAKDQLRQQIKDGIFTGDSVVELGKRVNQVFAGLDKAHSEMIARTESSRAIHEGLRLAAKESGVVSGFKLLAASDCCDICQNLNGNIVGLDEPFKKSEYDNSLLPVHPSCRCTCVEILK